MIFEKLNYYKFKIKPTNNCPVRYGFVNILTYFVQDKDIYLAFVYIPPANSTFYAKSGTGIESLYRELEDDIQFDGVYIYFR